MSEPGHEFFSQYLRYDSDTGILTWTANRGTRKCAGLPAGSRHKDGYLHVKICGGTFMVHRIAWMLHHRREIPAGVQIDHRNGKRNDNRISNLRSATDSQNKWNSRNRRTSRSGLKGATLHKASGLWAATIKADNVRHHLGYYRTAEEAHEAYKIAAARLHGDFARW